MRETFVRLFDGELAEPQRAVGAHVFGLFGDLNDPDRIVWLRGFSGMKARKEALEGFYFGPAWAAHRTSANDAIVDSDNALLLKRLAHLEKTARRPLWDAAIVRAEMIYLGSVNPSRFETLFAEVIVARIEQAGATVAAVFATLEEPNDFPRLPVREERVFVWFAGFDDAATERRFTERLNAQSGWRDGMSDEFLPAFTRKPEVVLLQPLVTYLDLLQTKENA
ncbi:MAG: NIPSNAP family protein [Gammaproteobacteria bacterium]|nr:NIPSNAP family protein [Gammaproteobacteria bacterium]